MNPFDVKRGTPRNLTFVDLNGVMARSPAPPKLLEDGFKRYRLSPLALGNRLEKHSFGFRVCLKRFIAFAKKDRNGSTFRKLCAHQLNSAVDYPTRSYSHIRILLSE